MSYNVLIGQSGGPTAVINASLYGAITEAFSHSETITTVYGMRNGIQGFLGAEPIDLSRMFCFDRCHPALQQLKVTPGAYLGSCRYKLPDDILDPVYGQIFERLRKWSIHYLLYIGGNDSMDTVWKLSEYARRKVIKDIVIIGIPKTIDNDLLETDHTPGYGSAAKYVASTVRDIVMDSAVYDESSVTIVELMGRHSGWLTAASVLARKYQGDNPVLVYLPERTFSVKQFIGDVESALKKKKSVVVCVSEGIADENKTFICEYEKQAMVDQFGHKLLSSCSRVLEQVIRRKLQVKVRSIELNVNQRCCSAMISEVDINEAVQFGGQGMKAALQGMTGKAITLKRHSSQPYQVSFESVDAGLICNREKLFPQHWIKGNGTDIAAEFLEYVTPLVVGRVNRDEEKKNVFREFIWLE